MTIKTNLPTSQKIPGTYQEFNVANAARGLTALTNRGALVGAIDSAGTVAAGVLTQVFSDAEADEFFGRGSELALMIKWCFKGQRAIGVPVQVWAVGIADAGGTAQQQAISASGTPTASGDIVFEVAGRTLRASVSLGDDDGDMADAINDAIAERLSDLPITAIVAGPIVTCTHVNTGGNGNTTQFKIVSAPTGVTVTTAEAVAGSGVIDITAALDELADKDYDLVAVSNHAAADVSDCRSHLDSMFDSGTKRWRHTIMAETGSLATAQALATAADDFRQLVVSAEGFKNTPSEVAAYLVGILGGASDPTLPWNNVELPDLYLPDTSDIPTNAELNAGINGGLFMLSVNENQSRAKIVRAVTTMTSLNDAPFYPLLDYTISRGMFYAARQIDIQDRTQFQRAKKNDKTLRRLRSVALAVLGELEEQEILQNVQEHAAQLAVETDASSPDRVNRAIPTSVVPPLNQIVSVLNLIVE